MSLCRCSRYGGGSILVGGLLFGAAFAITLAPKVGAHAGAAAADANIEPRVQTDLINKAREQGAVRVVVQLRVPDSTSEADIHKAQERLLRQLASLPHRVARRYSTIPFIALELSEPALHVVFSSTLVVGVTEDVLLQPLPHGTAPR